MGRVSTTNREHTENVQFQDRVKYLMRSGGRLYFRRPGCDLIRLLHEPGTAGFVEEYAAALRGGKPSRRAAAMYGATTLDDRLRLLVTPDDKTIWPELERSARKRAALAKRSFLLPPGWAKAQFIQQGGLCAVSGMAMRKDRKKRAPHAPSIDRIDSAGGYEPDNCRLVCYIVNCAMNMFTDAEFEDMCLAVAFKVAARRGKVLMIPDTPA